MVENDWVRTSGDQATTGNLKEEKVEKVYAHIQDYPRNNLE